MLRRLRSFTCFLPFSHAPSGLSIFKPYAFFDERWRIFESCAVPRDYANFAMAQELAKLLAEEPDIRLENGMHWRERPIEKDAPSRSFALELCLPSPKMAGFRARGLCAADIALRCSLDAGVVRERMAVADLPPDEVERVAEDVRKYRERGATGESGPSLAPQP